MPKNSVMRSRRSGAGQRADARWTRATWSEPGMTDSRESVLAFSRVWGSAAPSTVDLIACAAAVDPGRVAVADTRCSPSVSCMSKLQ